jgi:hypothetical protein
LEFFRDGLPEKKLQLVGMSILLILLSPGLECYRGYLIFNTLIIMGLKINFHKSEVYVFGVQQDEKERLANMLNCVLGELPLKYLGIPVSNKHLNISAFSFLIQKLHKRLDPWRGKFLTSGGRQILTNTCLSSIPLYCMGFYWLQDGVYKQMDNIRAIFVWQGT